MKLIIMRHGQASWSAGSDSKRPLTDHGRKEVQATANLLLPDWSVDCVLASPYLRAQQTGKIVADILHCKMDILEDITPDGHPPAVIKHLPEDGTVLLASHMPLVGRLTGLLCEGTMSSGISFPTASAVVLEMDVPAAGMANLIKRVSF